MMRAMSFRPSQIDIKRIKRNGLFACLVGIAITCANLAWADSVDEPDAWALPLRVALGTAGWFVTACVYWHITRPLAVDLEPGEFPYRAQFLGIMTFVFVCGIVTTHDFGWDGDYKIVIDFGRSMIAGLAGCAVAALARKFDATDALNNHLSR